MADVQPLERSSFYVAGNVNDVAPKLAEMCDQTEPGGTGTGLAKALDLSQFDDEALTQLGINPEEISASYTINRLHRNMGLSEIMMAFVGQQVGMQAIAFGYKNRPGVTEVVPVGEESPIQPDRLYAAGLELVVDQ